VNSSHILKLIIYRRRIYLRITVTVGPPFTRSLIYRRRIHLRITVTVGPLLLGRLFTADAFICVLLSPLLKFPFIRTTHLPHRSRIQFAHYRHRCWSPLLLERLIYRTEFAFTIIPLYRLTIIRSTHQPLCLRLYLHPRFQPLTA
jgi:hypothetical protein